MKDHGERKCSNPFCSYSEKRGSRLGMFLSGKFYCDSCYEILAQDRIRNFDGFSIEDGRESLILLLGARSA